jgi:hypothetical protein
MYTEPGDIIEFRLTIDFSKNLKKKNQKFKSKIIVKERKSDQFTILVNYQYQ